MPGLAIEMVKESGDVIEIEKFASPTGDAKDGAQKLRSGVDIDFGFIALYTAVFLTFSYWLRRANLRRALLVAVIAAIFALATAGFDVLENFRLYAVLDQPDRAMLENLHIATELKWLFCFATTALLSALFFSRRDRGFLLGIGLIFVSVLGVVGLFFYPLLEIAFGILGVLLFIIGLFVIFAPQRFVTGKA